MMKWVIRARIWLAERFFPQEVQTGRSMMDMDRMTGPDA